MPSRSGHRREALDREEEEMGSEVEACAECTQKCVLIHGKHSDSSPRIISFFKVMVGDHFTKILYLPPKFARKVAALVGQNFLLEDWTKRRWRVELTNLDGELAFQEGWQAFSSHHALEFGDFAVFHYIMGSHFVVQLFSRTGCEKQVSIEDRGKKRNRTSDEDMCHATDKGSMNKEEPITSALSGSNLGKNENCRTIRIEENVSLVKENDSHCADSDKRRRPESKADPIEIPDFVTDRDVEHIREDGNSIFNFSRLETLIKKSSARRANNSLVHTRNPPCFDTPLRDRIETCFADEDTNPVEAASKVACSNASKFETDEKNDTDEASQKDALYKELPSRLSHLGSRKLVFLRDPEEKLWPVLYVQTDHVQRFTTGWDAFSKANNIRPGDECAFEVENKPRNIFGVRIIRRNN